MFSSPKPKSMWDTERILNGHLVELTAGLQCLRHFDDQMPMAGSPSRAQMMTAADRDQLAPAESIYGLDDDDEDDLVHGGSADPRDMLLSRIACLFAPAKTMDKEMADDFGDESLASRDCSPHAVATAMVETENDTGGYKIQIIVAKNSVSRKSRLLDAEFAIALQNWLGADMSYKDFWTEMLRYSRQRSAHHVVRLRRLARDWDDHSLAVFLAEKQRQKIRDLLTQCGQLSKPPDLDGLASVVKLAWELRSGGQLRAASESLDLLAVQEPGRAASARFYRALSHEIDFLGRLSAIYATLIDLKSEYLDEYEIEIKLLAEPIFKTAEDKKVLKRIKMWPDYLHLSQHLHRRDRLPETQAGTRMHAEMQLLVHFDWEYGRYLQRRRLGSGGDLAGFLEASGVHPCFGVSKSSCWNCATLLSGYGAFHTTAPPGARRIVGLWAVDSDAPSQRLVHATRNLCKMVAREMARRHLTAALNKVRRVAAELEREIAKWPSVRESQDALDSLRRVREDTGQTAKGIIYSVQADMTSPRMALTSRTSTAPHGPTMTSLSAFSSATAAATAAAARLAAAGPEQKKPAASANTTMTTATAVTAAATDWGEGAVVLRRKVMGLQHETVVAIELPEQGGPARLTHFMVYPDSTSILYAVKLPRGHSTVSIQHENVTMSSAEWVCHEGPIVRSADRSRFSPLFVCFAYANRHGASQNRFVMDLDDTPEHLKADLPCGNVYLVPDESEWAEWRHFTQGHVQDILSRIAQVRPSLAEILVDTMQERGRLEAERESRRPD